MREGLKPKEWPHFMERKNSRTYKSCKVLGKMFDQVDRVDFTPDFDLPFDQRILTTCTTDNSILKAAAEMKIAYDQDMRRIMLQHDIATDLEVWSTFVMHHALQSNDYKFHEVIGGVSSALKERYREECFKAAGGKDFEVIGPFVAAMYKVTSDEMNRAKEECHKMVLRYGVLEPMRMKDKASMPLMSFPWLFPEILGRIALGELPMYAKVEENRAEIAKRSNPKFIPNALAPQADEDVIQTKKGEIHRGEKLVLFDSGEEAKPPERQSSRTQVKDHAQPGSSSDLLGLDFEELEKGSSGVTSPTSNGISRVPTPLARQSSPKPSQSVRDQRGTDAVTRIIGADRHCDDTEDGGVKLDLSHAGGTVTDSFTGLEHSKNGGVKNSGVKLNGRDTAIPDDGGVKLSGCESGEGVALDGEDDDCDDADNDEEEEENENDEDRREVEVRSNQRQVSLRQRLAAFDDFNVDDDAFC